MTPAEVRLDPRAPDFSIEELEITYRASRVLRRAGILTVGHLVGHSRSSLLEIDGLGGKTLGNIEDGLAAAGYALAASEPRPRRGRPKERAAINRRANAVMLRESGMTYRQIAAVFRVSTVRARAIVMLGLEEAGK